MSCFGWRKLGCAIASGFPQVVPYCIDDFQVLICAFIHLLVKRMCVQVLDESKSSQETISWLSVASNKARSQLPLWGRNVAVRIAAKVTWTPNIAVQHVSLGSKS
eukprot:5207532-Amphidinium_carterae.1